MSLCATWTGNNKVLKDVHMLAREGMRKDWRIRNDLAGKTDMRNSNAIEAMWTQVCACSGAWGVSETTLLDLVS